MKYGKLFTQNLKKESSINAEPNPSPSEKTWKKQGLFLFDHEAWFCSDVNEATLQGTITYPTGGQKENDLQTRFFAGDALVPRKLFPMIHCNDVPVDNGKKMFLLNMRRFFQNVKASLLFKQHVCRP